MGAPRKLRKRLRRSQKKKDNNDNSLFNCHSTKQIIATVVKKFPSQKKREQKSLGNMMENKVKIQSIYIYL